MLLMTKMVADMLLPPGGLVLLMLWGLWKARYTWGKALVVLSAVLLYALSTAQVRDALTRPLEFQYPVFQAQQTLDAAHTAIVLLGGGVYEQAPEYQHQDVLRDAAMMRTLYAAKLAKQTGLAVYASGGKVLNATQQWAEGEVMRRFLVQVMGLPEEQVVAENLANNTWENATRLQTILHQRGIHTVVLVTSAWHMPRSVACFQAQGLQVIAAPTDFRTKMVAYRALDYMPDARNFRDASAALHEYLGLLFYRVRYGM